MIFAALDSEKVPSPIFDENNNEENFDDILLSNHNIINKQNQNINFNDFDDKLNEFVLSSFVLILMSHLNDIFHIFLII